MDWIDRQNWGWASISTIAEFLQIKKEYNLRIKSTWFFHFFANCLLFNSDNPETADRIVRDLEVHKVSILYDLLVYGFF